jgi:CDP-paratose 2-epimerase
MSKNVLITGGAGFVGSSLAIQFKQAFEGVNVSAFDNLHRRGSELIMPRLKAAGVAFHHGDVRCAEDLEEVGEFDLLIDCAAEPSVQAGAKGSPKYVLNNNLAGTINCMEAARLRAAAFVLLSTSRVYPISALNSLPFSENNTRFCWEPARGVSGFSPHGVAESFPLEGARSFYGASKLAAELVLQEYVHNAGMRAIINRCGILAGPWQMGKVDQGVITLWVARHYYGKPLKYIGFGGQGKQVRDLLHVRDLFDLLVRQIEAPETWDGRVYNVGGGLDVSLSLMELTGLCQAVTGRRIAIDSEPRTSSVDLRIYITDARKASEDFRWKPAYSARDIVEDIYSWIDANHNQLEPILA